MTADLDFESLHDIRSGPISGIRERQLWGVVLENFGDRNSPVAHGFNRSAGRVRKSTKLGDRQYVFIESCLRDVQRTVFIIMSGVCTCRCR